MTLKDRLHFHLMYVLNTFIDLETKDFSAYISSEKINTAISELNTKGIISAEILDLIRFTADYIDKEFYYLRLSKSERRTIDTLYMFNSGMDISNYEN